MTPLGLPQACEAVSVLVTNAATQLHAMSQALIRSDIDVDAQRSTALSACQLARKSIVEIERMLKAPSIIADGAVASMQLDCPWRLTLAAVRKYLNLLGRHATEADARGQLRGMANHCSSSKAVPRELDNGCIQYRGGRPLRPRLIVKREGDELVLIDVLLDY